MGILDDLLGSVLGRGAGQPGPPPASAGGGSLLNALLPVVLAMLASRGQTGSGGGGGLGDLVGGVLGRIGGAGGGAGGLGDLLERMQRAGFGEQARSWVGTGQNMPISPDAMGQIFGRGGLEAMARQAGLTPEETSKGLSQLLPEVVDHVTPQGEVPALDQLVQSVESLQRRLGA